MEHAKNYSTPLPVLSVDKRQTKQAGKNWSVRNLPLDNLAYECYTRNNIRRDVNTRFE